MGLHASLARVIAATPLAYFPVRVRKGPAKGARWTMVPFSNNWRNGGSEQDIESALRYVSQIEGMTFWDFGAHFGIHTVGLALQAGPTGEVVAFEPDPVAFARLKYHVELNSLTNVKMCPCAASASTGTSTLYFSGGAGSSCSHLKYYAENDMSGILSAVVQTVAPDDLVERGQIREPNLIKVDVQGHGAQALAGSIKSIARSRPVIAFSNHSPAELDGTAELLKPLGYRPVDFSGKELAWANADEAILLPK
jgi:FkbM family methyltransferase